MITLEFGTLAIAASLAMDAFSVSICLGLCHEKLRLNQALVISGAFSFFQFFMPLVGAEIAEHLSGFFDVWTPWIAAILIFWVAFHMIEGAYKNCDKRESCLNITLRNIIILAFATSLDALAVGFSIRSTGGPALSLAVYAGATTFILSLPGALAGKMLGQKAGRGAEYFGGGVLCLIALRILLAAQ